MRRIIVRARARAEIEEAFDWYRVRSTTAAAEFVDAVDHALSSIADAPDRYPVVRGRLRRLLLPGFPYAVYYKAFERSVSVVGVIHGRRHPDTWLRGEAP